MVLTWLISITLVGCSQMSTMGKQGRGTAFEAAVETYAKMLRWGYYDEAAHYLRGRDGVEVEVDLERIARFRISSYELKTQLLSDTGHEGRVIARIEYYEIDSGVLRTLNDEQNWWFETTTKQWFLASPLPAFGREQQR